MRDTDGKSGDKSFSIDKAKNSRAVCKICKGKCLLGAIRVAKYLPDIVDKGRKKNWHHVDCIFKQFLRQRISTKRIKSSRDLDGWCSISKNDRKIIEEKIRKSEEDINKKLRNNKQKRKFLHRENGKNLSCKVSIIYGAVIY